MAPKIYTSPVPTRYIPSRSVYTHLFAPSAPNYVGAFPASHPAYIDAASGTVVNRGQVKKVTLALGHGLRNHPQAKLKRGDTILIYSANSVAFPLVMFGAVAAGIRVTLANSAYNAHELEFQFTDSRAKLIFTSEDGAAVARETLKSMGLSAAEADKKIILIPNSLDWLGGPSTPMKPEIANLTKVPDLLTLGSLLREEKFDGQLANETVYLCYSSGTTGKPKGVETTHRNIVSVGEIVQGIYPPVDPHKDRMLGILPFYHIYGAVKLVNFPFLVGLPVYVMPRFDPVQFCTNIQKYKITSSLVVPPVLVFLSRHPIVEKFDLSSLDFLLSGAAPLGAPLAKQVIDRLHVGRKGRPPVHILQGYGLTETSPTTHVVPPEWSVSKVGSVGLLLPNLEARLVVDGEGDGLIDAAEGEPGELWVRGPNVMKGYLNNVAATTDCLTPDKWFKTGDIAIRDKDGFYWIVDRRKELIKYKGFQVPPAELESVLLTHPQIADAAVIGVYSDGEATELPRAYVVHSSPESIKTPEAKAAFETAVIKWTEGKVARHKFLRGGVVAIDLVPKSAAGKILRRELREKAKAELAGADPATHYFKTKL